MWRKKVSDKNLHLSKDPCNIIYAETINVLHVLYRCKKEYFAREYSAEESFPIDPSADKKNQRKQKQISFQPEGLKNKDLIYRESFFIYQTTNFKKLLYCFQQISVDMYVGKKVSNNQSILQCACCL